MTPRTVQQALYGVAVAGFVAAAWMWVDAVPRPHPIDVTTRRSRPYPPTVRQVDTASTQRAMSSIVSRNPFRLDRRPARTRFVPWAETTAVTRESTAGTVVRPSLTLIGLLGGPPWLAIVRTEAGAEVIRQGEATGGIELVRVRRDTVVLAGFDTTWTLTLEPP